MRGSEYELIERAQALSQQDHDQQHRRTGRHGNGHQIEPNRLKDFMPQKTFRRRVHDGDGPLQADTVIFRTVDDPQSLAFIDAIVRVPHACVAEAVASPLDQVRGYVWRTTDQPGTTVINGIDIFARQVQLRRVDRDIVLGIFRVLHGTQQGI